jgi:hypothetical protein
MQYAPGEGNPAANSSRRRLDATRFFLTLGEGILLMSARCLLFIIFVCSPAALARRFHR